ncbi:MAG: hypothetical protein KAU14_00495 [Thermoplasmata archaeon]|nr:hypothetical protein [Thermoplasmata archaeon]
MNVVTMSIRVELKFENLSVPKLTNKVPEIGKFTRLFCGIRFKTKNGWYDTQNAIVDTGAPMTLIPLDMWNEINTRIVTDYEIFGLSHRKECLISVLVGKVTALIVDEKGNHSDELDTFAYLALTNKVPLIIGFKGLLSNFKVCFDQEKDNAFIEVRA